MSQMLDLTQRAPVLCDRHNELPEVWIHSGNGSGVFLVAGKRVRLRSYYDQGRGRGQRRLKCYRLRDPGAYLAVSFGGPYGFRRVLLFDLGADRELRVVGTFEGVVEAMRAARGRVMV